MSSQQPPASEPAEPLGAAGPSPSTPPADSPTGSQPDSRSTTSAPTKDPGTRSAAKGRRGSQDDPLRGSRTSGIWAGVLALVVLLILLAIFILQNTQETEVSFLGWTGSAPLSATILIAAAGGALLVAAAGALRILQLRRRVKRERKRS